MQGDGDYTWRTLTIGPTAGASVEALPQNPRRVSVWFQASNVADFVISVGEFAPPCTWLRVKDGLTGFLMTRRDWGPLVTANWWLFGSGAGNNYMVTEILYDGPDAARGK